ncbi:MAG: heme-binding protein [Blastopirellula sp.]|nr:MAG: heme-binding protein [Blastopirellula sp.]
MVVRTDLDGSYYEVLAGGLRNAYDLVFNRQGDLFVHDSDMEWDEGLAWHRPTRLLHILPGSEFGWRSGWAKWPEYYPDSVPSVLDTGAGSPTGMAVYDHHKYPPEYQNRLFLTDWANGRLMTAKLDRKGAGYKGKLELFLQGDPLTVTDLEVGPDGLLYFCSGGRGTEGGLFRISYKGELPEGYDTVGTGIAAAIQQPQPNSAWGRQNIASIQIELGDKWGEQVQGVAIAEENPPHFRTRALDLMRLYGPVPNLSFLLKLTRDSEPEVQIKAIEMLSHHEDTRINQRLEELLKEKNPTVRRKACEMLTEINAVIALTKFQHCLTSLDRFEVWSARRLLEKQAIDTWFDEIIKTDNPRLFNQGALAALIAHPTKERAVAICARAEQLLGAYVGDADFMNMLRVIQVALHRGNLEATDIGNLATMIADEFPASDHNMNRELIRTLAFFKNSKIIDRYVAHLDSGIPNTERLHLAMHLTFIKEAWTPRQKLQLLSHLEKGLEIDGGEGLRGYVEMSTKQFVKNLSEQEKFLVLSMGHLWPNAALATLFTISETPDRAMLETLRAVDREIAGREGKVIERFRNGIVALLAESGEADMMAYLREVFQNEPERRGAVAFGLAQQPSGENFPLLLEALPILEGKFATTVLTQLKNSTETSDDPHHIRNVLLLGLKLKDQGGHSAIRVLEKWTGEFVAKNELLVEERLIAWQAWFAETHPDLPAAELVNNEESNWDMKELMDFFTDKEFHGGNRANGATLFKTAKCADCHRHGQSGEAVGPDLTSISKRFQKKQILESILFPSHIVSDQYASTKILTVDGKTYIGIMTAGLDDTITIMQNNGEKVTITEAEIEDVAASTKSVMPDGLIDALTVEEIADLMTFMNAVPEAIETNVAEEAGSIQR